MTQKVGSNLEIEEQKNQPPACGSLPFSSCPQLHAVWQGTWHTCVWTPSHVHAHPQPLDGPGGETHTSSGNRLRAESFKAWGWRHPIKRTEKNISKQNLSNIYVHEDHLESTLEHRFPGPTPRDEALVSLGWGPRIFISNNLHKMLMKQKRTLSHPRQVQRPLHVPCLLFVGKLKSLSPP